MFKLYIYPLFGVFTVNQALQCIKNHAIPLCILPSFYVAYRSASKNMFFSMTGLRCSNWSDHHIPPLKWSSPSMIKHPQSPYSFTWKELTCKGKGEKTTDQTGISTWVPWISSQVLYLLSYLVPDNEPSWQSQQ